MSVQNFGKPRQAQFHDLNLELSAFVLDRPWNSVVSASANDHLWKEELNDKLSNFLEIRRFVDTALVVKGRQDKSQDVVALVRS